MHNAVDDKATLDYLRAHSAMVVSTAQANKPHGAVVYYYCTAPDMLYFLTKSETLKARNLQQNPQVSVTIFDETELSTFQGFGTARVVTDSREVDVLMDSLTAVYAKTPDFLPPITKITAGEFQLISIMLEQAELRQFKNRPTVD